jgi:tRNA pseudouridine38-40 synthase
VSLLLRLAYDGTDFHGYAKQSPRPDGTAVRTVQGELEAALAVLYKTEVPTRAASRTDAGVHAHGQLVAFEPPLEIPPEGVARGLAGKLPSDVTVLAAWSDSGNEGWPVDVRADNDGKYYRYRIRCTEGVDPLAVRYEWHLGRRLDPVRMQEAAARFVGTHDFAGFRASTCQARTTVRTVQAIEISWGPAAVGPMSDPGRLDPRVSSGEPAPGPASQWGPDWIEVHVWGTAFLQFMVRIIVGTLVDVGLDRKPPAWISELLSAGDRRLSGATAPAQGLTLVEVLWRRDTGGADGDEASTAEPDESQ